MTWFVDECGGIGGGGADVLVFLWGGNGGGGKGSVGRKMGPADPKSCFWNSATTSLDGPFVDVPRPVRPFVNVVGAIIRWYGEDDVDEADEASEEVEFCCCSKKDPGPGFCEWLGPVELELDE